MAFESRLEIIVDSSRAQGSLKRLEGDLNRTQAAGEKAFSGLQKGAMAFGAAFAAIGAGAAFKNTISTIMDFQAEMSGLQAVARASVEDLARLEQQARLLGATTAYGANQAAQAQKFLAQGGLEVNQILGATPQVMRLAQAGMLGLGEAADLATDVMAAMSLQISDIGRIGDVLVATSQAATTDVQGLGQALSYSAGQGADFNLTLEETVAALGMISSTGAKGSRAGTGLVGVIAQLSNVSGPAKDILDEANVSLADLNVEARGLVPVLETLAAANLSAGERQKIFGLEAAGAAGALLNGLPAYKAQIEALQDVNGLSEEAAKTMTDNLGGAFKGLGSAIAEANLQLGDSGLTKTLDAIVKTGTGVVQVLNGMGDEWAASTKDGEKFLSTAQSLVDTLELMAVLAGARLTTALLSAAGAQYQKLAATQASAVAEAAAASAVARRTAAEALAEKRLLGRAIAEVKATQGTAAHTAALAALNVQRARSIQASASNTVAVNAEAAAMGRASVAARGLSVAGRAGAGALALIGGPLGAAVIATGAIFHFREELGLVARPAITAAGAVDELALRVDGAADSMLKFEVAAFTAELVSLQAAAQQAEANLARLEETKNQPSSFGQGQQGDLWAGVDRQSAQLESLNNQINAREEAIGKLTDRINQLKDSEDDASDSTRNLNINIAGLDEEAAKAAKTLADNFESLKRTLDPSYSSLMDFWEGIELLNEAIDTSTIEGMTEYNRMVGLLTERYAEATKGSDDAKKALEQLTQQYDRQYQRGVQLTQAISDISAAYRRGDIDGQQYGRMLQSVRDEMAQMALEADPMAQEMARAWEEATNRIDETFSDAFAGAFDSFDSFADQLLDGFKRLLAELAYQATLKPIVVGFTGDMQSMLSGGGGGFGNTIGAARSLFSSGSSLLGGGSTAVAAGGLYSGASTGAAMGGLYGNAVTGGVASTGIMSSITAGVSAAMPWIAGGLAIDSLLGGGITKAISGLFGGGDTPFYGRVGTSDNSANIQQYKTDTALGTTGFARVQRVEKATSEGTQEWAANLFEASKALDSVIASTARSTTELADMKAAVNDFSVASGNASTLVKAQLVDRTLVALEAAGHDVSAAWGNLGAEELAARVERASGAMGLMSASSERLNLQFDIASSSALVAADRIAQLAGGVDQLAALQDSYYQAFFSDAERAANLQRELTQALSEMGYALPATREGFRALVEQQDRFTESGQQNYVQLLQLSGAFDQMQTVLADTSSSVDVFASRLAELNDQISTLEDDVRRAYRAFENQAFGQQLALLELMGDEQGALALQRERELQGMDPLLHETQRRIWAMQDEAEAQQKATQAAQQYIGELSRIRDQLNSSIGSINQWIDQRTATSGTPAMNLEAAGEQFARQLVLAENGDRDALQNITQYADRYLAAGEGMFASGSGFQRIQEDVLASLEGLPEALSDAEYIVDGFRDIVSNEMAREIERAIFSSQYKIDTLIEFAADASKLPKDLRTILGEQAHRLDSTLNYLLGENQLDNELRRLALESTNNFVSTVDYITGFELSESDKLLALSSSNTMTAVIDYIVGSDIDRGSRILALESSNAYSAMIDMILGRDISDDDRRLALSSTNQYASLIDYVVRSELTGGNRRLALSSLNEYDALIDYATRKDVTSADRRLALDNGNRYLSTMDYIVGSDIDSGSREMALMSSNRYLSIINLALGSDISRADRTLALESANRFDAVINYVVDSPLTGGDRRLALASGQSYEALIGYYVDRDVSQADRELALESGNRYLANIEYFVGRDISDDDRRLALSSNNRYVSVIDQLVGKQITGGDRRLSLNSTNSYLTTVDAVMKKGIAADVRTFGLSNSNSIMTTIDGVLASRLPSDVRTLALEDSNRFVTTLEAALADGRLTGDERKLLDARSETVVKTLKTNGLDLSKEEWAVINAASGTRRLELLADVAFGRTDLDELGKIEGNTKSLEERAYDQLASLNGLVGEMARTTDQFVGLNSNVVSLRDAINALGVAQNEAVRIEREQAVRGVEDEARVVTDRLSSTWDARSGALSEIKSIENWGKGKDIDRLRPIAEQGTGEGVSGWHYSNGKYRNWKGWEPYFNELTGQLRGSDLEDMTDNQFSSWLSSEKKKHDPGTWGAEYIEVLARRIRAQELVAKAERDNAYKVSLYNQLPSYTGSIDVYQQQLADLRKEYAELAGSAAPFAKGGVFTNSIVSTPTYFDMGLMGEEDPEAIMPLSRAPGGRLGVDASGLMRIPDGPLELPMPNVPLPQFPHLGSNDVLQVLQDVKRELQESRKENKRLQEESNRHAAAAVAVQQAGFNGQINEQKKGNAALDDMSAAARLEASR